MKALKLIGSCLNRVSRISSERNFDNLERALNFIFNFNPYFINVPLMQKPSSWFLLAKCLKAPVEKGPFK